MNIETLTRSARLPTSLLALSMVLVTVVLMTPLSVMATTVTVNEGNVTWTFAQDGGSFASHGFVMGPGTPPSGGGSMFVFTGANGTDNAILQTLGYAGVPLSYFTAIGYSTYQDHSILSVLLQFDIDYDCTDADETHQGRLYFDAWKVTGGLIASTWQNWDCMVGAGWYPDAAPIVNNMLQLPVFSASTPGTWAQIVAQYPNARVKAIDGVFGLKAGSGYTVNKNWHADALRVRIETPGASGCPVPSLPPPIVIGDDITWDFETAVPIELSRFTIE